MPRVKSIWKEFGVYIVHIESLRCMTGNSIGEIAIVSQEK